MLEALRTPSTRARIRQAMFKTWVHAKKKGQLDGVDLHDLTVDSPEVQANVMQIAEDLTKLERISFENDVLFGTSPVIFREGRRVKKRDEVRTSGDEATCSPATLELCQRRAAGRTPRRALRRRPR